MRRLAFAVVGAVVGYLLGLFGGLGLVPLLSGNHYDPGVEAAMTSAFVLGPIVALIGIVLGKPKPRKTSGIDPNAPS